jgi:hypothetical protein
VCHACGAADSRNLHWIPEIFTVSGALQTQSMDLRCCSHNTTPELSGGHHHAGLEVVEPEGWMNAAPDRVLRISCSDCRMQGTTACEDCVVTFLCSRDERESVVLDLAEQQAIRRMQQAGLVPLMRHEAVNAIT